MRHLIPKYARWWLLGLLLAALALPAHAAVDYTREIEVLEDFFKKHLETEGIVGLSVGFMKDDFVWARGFGYADLENRTRATEKSSYRLASVTKPMTAVAILQLVEKGKIDLDADVRKYVPYFPSKKKPVTVRHLLGHLGGITHYKEDWELHIKEPKDTRDAIAIFENYDLVADPGTRYRYTSYGYNLLGAVIEGASKKSYGDYMTENIWGPLGMTDTRLDSPDRLIPHRVRGYRYLDGKLRISEFKDMSSRFAAGGTRSTVVDLLKFAKGVISGKLLSPETLQMMSTPMATKSGYSTGYGMGWSLAPLNGHFVMHHGGSQAETATWLFIMPRQNFAIALGCNTERRRLDTEPLFQLILGETYRRGVYIEDKAGRALEQGMADTFNYGFGYFDKHRKSLTEDEKELTEAFAYFNRYVNPEALASDYEKTEKKIKDGRHPAARQALVKVGALMAEKLREKFGPDRMKAYHRMGDIPFFNDYIRLYEGAADYPAHLTFNDEFEAQVRRWAAQWERAAGNFVRGLRITPHSDFDAVEKGLKKAFAGAALRPNFIASFHRVVEYFYSRGKRDRALKAAGSARELYPGSARPYAMLGNTHMYFGEYEQAEKWYERGREKGAVDRDYLDAGGLNRFAYFLAGRDRLEAAVKLLKMALEFYPEEANLYDSLGEMYLRVARGYYRQALQKDAGFQHARDMLKHLGKK